MRGSLRGLLLPAVATAAVLAVLISLGNWQMWRLAWKEELIARVAERLVLPAVEPGPEALADSDAFAAANEFRPVRLTGAYDAEKEVRVFTALSAPKGPYGGPGAYIVTPFRPAGTAATVFINRGFVPQDRIGEEAAPPAGVVSVEGPLRSPERGSWLTPDADPEKRLFFARDPASIAAAMAIDTPVTGFFIDLGAAETPPSGLPQAGETRTVFANSHLEYALTWYGLAAGLAAVFAAFAYGRLRRENGAGRLTDSGGAP